MVLPPIIRGGVLYNVDVPLEGIVVGLSPMIGKTDESVDNVMLGTASG